jgi:hypothetical protein
MSSEIRDKLKFIKRKLELIERRIYVILGWILVFLCSLLIITFLYKCFESVSGKDTLNRSDWIGFLVCLVLLIIGIISIVFWKKDEPI